MLGSRMDVRKQDIKDPIPAHTWVTPNTMMPFFKFNSSAFINLIICILRELKVRHTKRGSFRQFLGSLSSLLDLALKA